MPRNFEQQSSQEKNAEVLHHQEQFHEIGGHLSVVAAYLKKLDSDEINIERILLEVNNWVSNTKTFQPTPKSTELALEAALDLIQELRESKDLPPSLTHRLETLNRVLTIISEKLLNQVPQKKRHSITRRTFLGLMLGSTAAFVTRQADMLHMGFLSRENIEEKQLAEDLKHIREVYGLDISTAPPLLSGAVIGYERTTSTELNHWVKMLRRELSYYPPDFFASIHLQTITPIKKLTLKGEQVGGICIASTGALCLSIDQSSDATIHHEIFHAADIGANLFQFFERIHQSSDWQNIYPCTCTFQESTKQFSDTFMRDYSKNSQYEDRATLAEHLLSPQKIADLYRLVATLYPDQAEVLQAKIDYIKALYFTWSNGQMNDQYWQDLLDGKVGEGYFSTPQP